MINGRTMTARRYPIGIQTFSEIIRGGYVYIDKTFSITASSIVTLYLHIIASAFLCNSAAKIRLISETSKCFY